MNLLEVGLNRLCETLGTDLETGLTAEQVLRNRRDFGENLLFEKKNTILDLLRKIFGDMMILLFLLVCLFDYLETENAASLVAFILVCILYSSFVLATHLYISRIKKKVEKYSKCKYHVKRGGRVCTVSKSELVPGDLLLLDKGDVMPCDGIIVKQSALKILEANVTGTRVPVFKRSYDEVQEECSALPYFDCILFSGCVILHGSAKVFVCNTGKNIFDNKNFTVSRQNTTVSRLYDMAMNLKKQIYLFWVIACFFLFAWGVFCGQEVFNIFHYVCAMMIAAFPDSIEHLCDLSIAYMTSKLYREGVVLRNDGAIDRLCDANCVFVNSSEYLFYSHPVANAFYFGDSLYYFKNSPTKAVPLLENLILAQSSQEYYSGNADERGAERAIVASAASVGIQKVRLYKEYMMINRYDYDLRYGYACALVMHKGRYRLIIRGNPNSVLSSCSQMIHNGVSVPINEAHRATLRMNTRQLAGMCERVIAVATLDLSSPSTGDQRALCRGMTYMGMFGLSTPISASSANAVSSCQKSGIQTYLLTNDYPETVSALAKSVSIIGEGDYQYALSYQTYARMDRGIFIADIEKYKAYCSFPAEEKQSIVKYHKDNGDITITLTGSIYDTLPQMESDISFVGADEKLNAVRLNSDILLKEKKYELVPFCINWARVSYRNLVHIMQYMILFQISLALCMLIGVTANQQVPFSMLPMIVAGIGLCIPSAMNIFHRKPGTKLEDGIGIPEEERVVSLRVLIAIPLLAGVTQTLAIMIARQIAFYASSSATTAESAALFTLIFASYFSSLALKFDTSIFKNIKEIGKSELITFSCCAIGAVLLTVSPLTRFWQHDSTASVPFVICAISFLLALMPLGIIEWMKILKRDDSAIERDS